MREVLAVALSLLALVGAVAAAAPASVAGPAFAAQDNDSMGDEVSSFMHSQSGQTDEEVQAGMWNAAYENASDRGAVVEQRTADLEERLQALEEEKQALIEARENGSISDVEYRARMSAVVGRMAGLNQSLAQTERQAEETGVDRAKLQQLRQELGNMTGPEIAEVARSLAGGPPDHAPAGAKGGGPGGQAGPPNGTQGPPDDDQGPPNGTDQGNGDGSDRGDGSDKGGGSDKGDGNDT